MDKHEFLSLYGVDDLAHYGVKGMRKGVRNENDPLGNGDTSNFKVTDVPGLMSSTRTTSSTAFGPNGVSRESTYQYSRGKIDRFVNKMFDHKVSSMRGNNPTSRVKQGKVNKFMDKLFKQVVRKAKK